jgi:hypothetical protein
MTLTLEASAFGLVAAVLGGLGIYVAALALGIRHGIDWDHIAAITDITSTTASVEDARESWLIGEPAFVLTDESHHLQHAPHEDGHAHPVREPALVGAASAATASLPLEASEPAVTSPAPATGATGWIKHYRPALWLGTLYALGHGAVVVALGVLAIVARELLPTWVDPIMERVVGVTLIVLSLYLFYSLYRYFRGGEFHLRSRWMLVFAGVRNAWRWVRSRTGAHEHVHAEPQRYGAGTAWSIGMIHGVGAETGTQALIIATAVGAASTAAAVGALMFFVFGLLISNSFITVASTVGFVSAKKRQLIYVGAGMLAAVFSLVVGLAFLGAFTEILPNLEPYFRWIGGPDGD